MAVPRSAFPVPRLDPVSNCHTRAKPLDCLVKYAATIPPADLRDPRGPDGRADGPGRGGVGRRGAHGGAVGEVARRVAHEIKNPLTSMRIAVDQLGRSGGPVDGRATAVEVLAAETRRLERLAKEFSEFGRLPEGPKSEVDLVDLLVELGRSAVPDDVAVTVRANGAGEGPPCRLLGH